MFVPLVRIFSENPSVQFCQTRLETRFFECISRCRSAFSGFYHQATFNYPIIGSPATMYQPFVMIDDDESITFISRAAIPVFVQHGRYGQIYSSLVFPAPHSSIMHSRVLPSQPPSINPLPGAIGFYNEVIKQYVRSLQEPLQILLKRMETVAGNPHAAEAELDKVIEEKKKVVSDLKTKIEDFMSMDSEIYLAMLKQVVDLALSSDKPLFKDGAPTQELPLDLCDLTMELETVRQMKAGPEKQDLSQKFVPRLMQGLPGFQRGLGNAWKAYLKRPDFLSLTKSLQID